MIYYRVDSEKPYLGLTTFAGERPTQAEAMVAKNYLSETELKVLNNIVSGYFDWAEINAIEHKPMRMRDYIDQLDRQLSANSRKLLDGADLASIEMIGKKARGGERDLPR